MVSAAATEKLKWMLGSCALALPLAARAAPVPEAPVVPSPLASTHPYDLPPPARIEALRDQPERMEKTVPSGSKTSVRDSKTLNDRPVIDRVSGPFVSETVLRDARAPRYGDFVNERGETCRFRDRFDRSAVLSYRLDDAGHFRLSLQHKRLSEGFRPASSTLMLSFSLSGDQARLDRCRADSPVQGLLGSLWNESVSRRNSGPLPLFLRPQPVSSQAREYGF